MDRLAAEDRCHLNGLAMKDGKPTHGTAVVVDVATGEVICTGLSMPHSPRWHGDTLHVLNAGAGEFGRMDLATGRFLPIAFCPGYLRGLTFIGNHVIVGLSEPRENRTFAGLHWARVTGVVTELYDMAALPKARPPLVGFRSTEIRRVISVEG